MKILVTEPVHEAGIEYLRGEFEVDIMLNLSPSALAREIGEYDAVITRSQTPVTAELLRSGDGRLKVVGRAGIGVDNIDVAAATERGVAVVNAPNGNVRAAAEHTIALLFALCRNIPQADALMREGVWGKVRFVGCEIAGKALGIIGLGKVGTQVARRAKALDMEVIAYDPFVEQGPDVPLVELDDLLRQVDVVTLHVPLTPLTQGMIGERELGLMKRSAFLINCARGRVVDEAALYLACRDERIAGAALDVFETEPLTASPLLELTNVIVTPHLGGTTHEAMRASSLEVAVQVRALLLGEYAPHIINPECLVPGPKSRVQSQNAGDSGLRTLDSRLPFWQPFGRVIFDCDSTLSKIEGIDELAAMNGVPYEVAQMTREAMGGAVPFEEVFARRLDLIKPNRGQLDGVGMLYTATLVEDAALVVEALGYLGIEVRLVSGGYREALVPLAKRLGLPAGNLYANDLLFNEQDQYAGFDAANPLCRSRGKAEVCRDLTEQTPTPTLFIGDGASDVEVAEYVDLFVGYGGIEKRRLVQGAAPVYLHGESLAPLVIMAAGKEGCERLIAEPRFRPLVLKGLSILLSEGAADYRPECRPFFARLRRLCVEGICN